jgi:two-component system response regulator YesN
MLGIDLVARCYFVVVLRVEPSDSSEPFDYQRCQRVQQLVSSIVENDPDVFLLRKDMVELVLVMKGGSPEYLYEKRDLLLERLERQVEQAHCRLTVGSGTPQKRITDICRSFTEAMDKIQTATNGRRPGYIDGFDKAELLKVDKSAVEDYMRFGAVESFDAFFEAFIRPLGETALKSSVVNNYIFVDIVLATARFVSELGGDVNQVIPELDSIESVSAGVESAEQLREQARNVLIGALVFRDGRVSNHYAGVINRAQGYIDRHYMEPDLTLNGVAAEVSFSPCHFSAVFSQETGQTFKEYLTEIRIKKAKELLRTTTMKAFEICYQIGYNDPHYFSHVFHKNTGLTPIEFRLQVQTT